MVDNLGTFEFELIPQKKYIIRYFNACVPNYVPEQTIIVPCNDSSAVKFTSNVLLPDNIRMFDFANYKVPFFVTGYYFPNTIDNLNALRLKFTYNIVGKNDNTKYIENPGDIYDGYSLKVESALNEVVSYIVSIFDNLNSDCSERKSKLKIRITGFSDPRPISTKSIYDDDTINDQLLGISIDRGNLIDNTILSKLRAYYTLKFIQGKLANHNAYLKNKDNIVWEIEGLGVADDMLETELQRRVNIEIGLVKE